jgi:hypothetical protein
LVFDQGLWPDAYVGFTSQRSRELTETTPVVGNRLVGNQLLDGTRMGATNYPPIGAQELGPDAVPVARDAIFEGNTIARQSVGISVDPGHWDTLLRGNRMEHVSKPIENQGSRTVVQ